MWLKGQCRRFPITSSVPPSMWPSGSIAEWQLSITKSKNAAKHKAQDRSCHLTHSPLLLIEV